MYNSTMHGSLFLVITLVFTLGKSLAGLATELSSDKYEEFFSIKAAVSMFIFYYFLHSIYSFTSLLKFSVRLS